MKLTEKKTIEQIPRDRCTGCGACFSVCSAGAIRMAENAEGFLQPEIDSARCVGCGKCERACPVAHPAPLHAAPPTYAVWAKDEVRRVSSSGGAFTVLASQVLSQGGHVCGAAYREDWLGVSHVWTDTADGLSRMRGSKYVQSDTGHTYAEARAWLDKGEWVLYSGCPCQIAGLYGALGRDYPTLITVDIVCHGTPSPLAYRRFLTEVAQGAPIERVDFREKAYWGWGSATSVFLGDGRVYRDDCRNDPYFDAFLKGLSTRESCFHCPYASMDRVGDLTLGDFWGVGDIEAKLDDQRGTGLLFINTDKGRELIDRVRPQFSLLKAVPAERIVPVARTRNGRLLTPPQRHRNRDLFFTLLTEEGFHSAYAKTMRCGYDVGIIGWWNSMNYGSALTAFALNRTVRQLGKSVLMIPHPGMDGSDADSSGMRFARQVYHPVLTRGERFPDQYNSCCDTFLLGSDQLWCWRCIYGYGDMFYYLDFVNADRKKIAYATSYGTDWSECDRSERLRIGYLMSRFDHISVREKSGVDLCKAYGAEATQVLDPVFLCGDGAWQEVLSLAKAKAEGEYIFVYMLDPTAGQVDAMLCLSQRTGLPLKVLTDAIGEEDEKAEKLETLKRVGEVVISPSIPDWLYWLSHAAYVLTDSFHGFCFSILFRKQVFAFINDFRGSARFETIADITGLRERLVTSLDEFTEKLAALPTIDFAAVHARLGPEIARSRAWLESALNGRKEEVTVKEMALWKTIEHDRDIYRLKQEVAALQKQLQSLNAAPDAPPPAAEAPRAHRLKDRASRLIRRLRR